MEVLSALIFLMVLATSVWVLSDARSTGVKRGQVKASFLRPDMGPWDWFAACLLLWLIAFPLYLSMRSEHRRTNAKLLHPTTLTPQPVRRDSSLDELERLAQLRDRGVLTEQELQTQKSKLLGSPVQGEAKMAGFGACPKCGGAHPIGVAFCSRCGQPLAAEW